MEHRAEQLLEVVQSDHPVLRAIGYRVLALAACASLVLAVWAATSSPTAEAEAPGGILRVEFSSNPNDYLPTQLRVPTTSTTTPAGGID